MTFSNQKLKQIKTIFYASIVIIAIGFTSCSSDDDAGEDPMAEQNECEEYAPTEATNTTPGTWSEANERDLYANLITIPSDAGGGFVKVELLQSDGDLIPALFVDNNFEEGGTIIGGSAAQTNNESSRIAYFSVHPDTSYSVEVYPFVNALAYPVDYTITWEFFSRVDCFERNDTQAEAKKILFDETIEAYAIAGFEDYFIAAGDDKTFDWYKVELDEPGVIEAEVLDMPSDMRITMRLFNTAGSVQSFNFEWLTAETSNNNGRLSKVTSNQVLDPGTYFIELHSDFVQSRRSNSDLEPIPEHFDKTYKMRVTK